ncbi:MAG: amidohydrolase [Oscillospiraceae bacterium]|nr:amidohydrolase [Oscillospiraceae bacterium]
MNRELFAAVIEAKKEALTALAQDIWAHPELSLQEYHAAEVYTEFLRAEGFQVETNVGGIATAFTGKYGSGRPVIGLLGEFDALDGLSQQGGAVTPSPVVPGGCGHGCGHHLLGVGALAAAIAVKAYLQERGEGTVVFYGCPGEEGGAAKAFLARDGAFRDLDAALTWHPDDKNEVVSGTCMASLQVEYEFTGTAAHAANCPQRGRSALDAAELMNMGVQFLREHIRPCDMVHYAIWDAGGRSPNVVQARARLLYMVRSDCVKGAQEVLARVDRIAEGAALMTSTGVKRHFIDGTSDTVPNETLETLLYEKLLEAKLPEYTEQELAFAAALRKTFGEETGEPICRAVLPLRHSEDVTPGSTDVGDVSHLTPTVQLHTAVFPLGTPGHSWQAVSAGAETAACKGMLLAANVLAETAAALFESPETLAAAGAEFRRRTAGGYVCPIEPDAVPCIPGEPL